MSKDNSTKAPKEKEKEVNGFRDTYDTDFIVYKKEDKSVSSKKGK